MCGGFRVVRMRWICGEFAAGRGGFAVWFVVDLRREFPKIRGSGTP